MATAHLRGGDIVTRAADREIALMRDGGVYRVPVTLNGWLVRPFIADTGAGEVQVSTDVLRAPFPRAAASVSGIRPTANQACREATIHTLRYWPPPCAASSMWRPRFWVATLRALTTPADRTFNALLFHQGTPVFVRGTVLPIDGGYLTRPA